LYSAERRRVVDLDAAFGQQVFNVAVGRSAGTSEPPP